MDRKKIIKEYEAFVDKYECFSSSDDYVLEMHKAVLALLKEQEQKTGTWQWKIRGKAESGGTLGEAICDQCGKSTYATAVKGELNYCPNCGAKMMGDEADA